MKRNLNLQALALRLAFLGAAASLIPYLFACDSLEEATCGNGALDDGEQCDDGEKNNTNQSMCSYLCTLLTSPPTTSDDTSDSSSDSDSDPMTTATDSDTGTTSSGVVCGDGTPEGDEECDDGNDSNEDECLNTCLQATCGDGYTWEGVEICDDGDENGDYERCAADCQGPGPYCGDNEVYMGDDAVEECDDGNNINTDGCLEACKLAVCGDGYVREGVEQCDTRDSWCSSECEYNPRTVFVTSVLYSGNLGGLEGADAKCNALAKDKVPGVFKAWLSAGEESPSSRFAAANRTSPFDKEYKRVDDVVVAVGWDDLRDGTLETSINLDEDNFSVGLANVWTNTTPAGEVAGMDDCDGWTSFDNIFSGAIGQSDADNSDWTQPLNGKQPCGSTARLYCIEDPEPDP